MSHNDFDHDDLAPLFPALEAILMVADRPITAAEIAPALTVEPDVVDAALHALAAEYHTATRPRGFELRNLAGGWRIYSHPAHADIVGRFIVGTAQSKLSQAALETLAVIAYRQPISRVRISHIRGVNVDAVVRTLVARGFVEEVGWTDSGARLYGTTDTFLERMGFTTIHDLVPLAPYLPDATELDDLEDSL